MQLVISIIILAFGAQSFAQDHPMFRQSGQPIPRFVSLKSSTVNVRVGPGKHFPIEWVYKRMGYPVEIIEEFGHWRKIRDKDEHEGWVHYRLLSSQRSSLVNPSPLHNLIPVYSANSSTSRLIMELESGVQVYVDQCKDQWCVVRVKEHKGWMEQSHLWGIYPDETFED